MARRLGRTSWLHVPWPLPPPPQGPLEAARAIAAWSPASRPNNEAPRPGPPRGDPPRHAEGPGGCPFPWASGEPPKEIGKTQI
ncbi:uncharacterized protein LOC132536488 [Erinaceus europaeus]|uniref:Uncharacterized protein LOC132536488 n=1 Tax=Erinaceus europaeus TaxID=9365 RepID=A0ABM3WV02_ERIEU|nr:uncharacterized protein LOC132536488 [Erinaceus europaeus]